MRRAPLLLAALIAATLGWRSEARDVEPCTAERLCRSGGVECRFDRGDPAACEEDVKERGLVRVCTRSNANVYCPKDQIDHADRSDDSPSPQTLWSKHAP